MMLVEDQSRENFKMTSELRLDIQRKCHRKFLMTSSRDYSETNHHVSFTVLSQNNSSLSVQNGHAWDFKLWLIRIKWFFTMKVSWIVAYFKVRVWRIIKIMLSSPWWLWQTWSFWTVQGFQINQLSKPYLRN